MDYKTKLKDDLLSEININFLVNTILTNFKIHNKAANKCANILIGYMSENINNIIIFPKNNDELIEMIHILNKKCYEQFTDYLLVKYPDGNILRNNIPPVTPDSCYQQTYEANNNFVLSDPQVSQNEMIIISEDVKNELVKQYNCYQPVYGTNDISLLTKPIIPQNEMIIISEEEKNKLIKKYTCPDFSGQKSIQSVKIEANKTDEFLSYLTNPVVLQMFSTMVNQLNNNSNNNNNNNVGKEKNHDLVFDKILDIGQVQSLISKTAKETINTGSQIISENKSLLSKLENDAIEEANELPEEQMEIEIDLYNLTNETLPFVQQKIKELTEEKNRYASEKNFKMAKEIEKERAKIMDAVNAHKQKIKKQANENKNNVNSMLLSNVKDPKKDNVEILNLQFDPSNDYNDLKNIVINFNCDDKISEISLISYRLPLNPNNITRFNNKFIVYFNNKINKITIPPSNYDIKLLIDAIKTQANYLDFSISANNIITIKNTIGVKFDLMVEGDTVFPLLGFVGRSESYKDKLYYEASRPYDMDVNKKILFSLFGSTKDPVELEFDKEIIPQKPIILKKVARGIFMKQMQIKLTNSLDQCYDFIMPFKMCFSITYIK